MSNFKRRTFEILESVGVGNKKSREFDIFIVTLITLNVIAVILGTVESIALKYGSFLNIFEIVSVGIFTVEYLARLWSCTSSEKYSNTLTGRIKFALTPMLIIDLLAILPFYLPLLIPFDLRFLRVMRLLRLFLLFKLERYSVSVQILTNVMKDKKELLYLTVFMGFILLIVSSSLVYNFEHEAQPVEFSSIITSMWWAVSTLTTVGYGDVTPITPWGQFFGSVISILGVGLYALPAGILAAGFAQEIQNRKKELKCPHCKKIIEIKSNILQLKNY